MQKEKKFIILILFFIILFEGSGCMIATNKNITNLAFEYLSEKYPYDKFELIREEGDRFLDFSEADEFFYSSENLAGKYIYVYYNKEEKTFYDNYLDMKFSDQLDDAVNEIFLNSFPGKEFYFTKYDEEFTKSVFSSEMNPDIDFFEYIKKRGVQIYAFVMGDKTMNLQKTQKELEANIINSEIYFETIELFFIDDISAFSQISFPSTDILVNKKYIYKFTASMEDNSCFVKSKWES